MNNSAVQLFEGDQRSEFLNFFVGENKKAASKRQKGFPQKAEGTAWEQQKIPMEAL